MTLLPRDALGSRSMNKKTVLVVCDGHLLKTNDEKIWAPGILDYHFFSRYLAVFKKVYVAIRISETALKEHSGYPNLCSGAGVDFVKIPDFTGAREYIKKFDKVNKLILNKDVEFDCAIIRMPSPIAFQYAIAIRKRKKPYALEVVVDPWDAFNSKINKSLGGFVWKITFTMLLKYNCKKANGVSYVTRSALQNRYPCRAILRGETKKYFTGSYSSANISKEFFGESDMFRIKERYTFIHVANNINNYVKGHRDAIKIVKLLQNKGIDCNIRFIGDGELVKEFKRYAIEQGISDKVKFLGKISDRTILINELRNSDLFIFPSYGEGLPRVLLEAMAAGLPCVSTNVNGIPELLESDQMVSPGDIEGMAKKIACLLQDPKRMNELIVSGIQKAREYTEEKLQIQRNIFYEKLANVDV